MFFVKCGKGQLENEKGRGTSQEDPWPGFAAINYYGVIFPSTLTREAKDTVSVSLSF